MIFLFLTVGYVIVPLYGAPQDHWVNSRYWSICEGGALKNPSNGGWNRQDFSSSWWKNPCHVARNSSLVDWNSCPEDHTMNGAYEESLIIMRWWFQKCWNFHSEIENYPWHLFWMDGFTRDHSITENNKQCKSVQQSGPLPVITKWSCNSCK